MKQIVIKPIITEKSLSLAARGWYTFSVAEASRKPQIARAIGNLYTVTVVDVRTMIMHGKERHAGKKQKNVRKSDWKKALVKLKQGQNIDAFDVHESHPTHKTQ